MEETKIYIATHKKFSPPPNSIYIPISTKSDRNIPYIKDNTGDNISIKNPYYSELTVLYWIFKNEFCKYIGLVHYHRYFYKENYITKEEINNILNKYDFIVPYPIDLKPNVFYQYAKSHYKNDLILACEEIIRKDPSYKDAIRKVLNDQKFYMCNLFITNRELLNDYLSFLFPILFSLEEKIPYLNYSIYNQRVFGFLAERIFNIYLCKNNFNLYEYPVKDTFSLEEKIIHKVKTLHKRK